MHKIDVLCDSGFQHAGRLETRQDLMRFTRLRLPEVVEEDLADRLPRNKGVPVEVLELHAPGFANVLHKPPRLGLSGVLIPFDFF